MCQTSVLVSRKLPVFAKVEPPMPEEGHDSARLHLQVSLTAAVGA